VPELVAPTVSLHAAWLEAHAEWGPGQHEDGFGLRSSDSVESRARFAAWIERLTHDADVTQDHGHTSLYRWVVDNNQIVGGVALRYGDSAYIDWAGHIGFGIRPSARRRGLATWSLRQTLIEARRVGLTRVLLVCDVDNPESSKTIERCAGVLEEIRDTPHGHVKRYWIGL
jgi:predicted acetyltransferase